MHNNPGVEIARVLPDSLAHAAGIAPGDIILSVNGHRVCDLIDFMFFRNEEKLHVIAKRKDKRLSFPLTRKEGQDVGIELKPFKIKTCTNRCIFCFVHQLPKGLRKTLYLKDEDYRMSFLYGNYITLTNLSPQEKRRIIQQKLSPLYLSVHSTNGTIRNTLLGNSRAPDILKEIAFFKEHRIRMHCQIVLCPGYNDGRDLEKTIRDLYKFYPYVTSIALVPVGITSHRRSGPKLKSVEKDDAVRALSQVDSFQKRFRKKHGDSIVYASDELYIKAEADFPPLREYGDLPQIENGVGMIAQFMHQAKRVKIPQPTTRKRFVTFTGLSFYPYLTRFIDKLKKSGTDVEAIPVENTFFGKSITVAGLLTGRDVIKTLHELIRKDDILLIPDVVMKEGEELFLDDLSRKDLEELLAVTAVVVESTPKGLADAIAALS
jgi:putative radical SAM enzyme (TIGR03279 family)